LRRRKEDIKLLANHFIRVNNIGIRCPAMLTEDGKTSRRFSKLKDIAPDALEMLGDYNWPGNVRELEHVIRTAMVESRKDPKATTLKKEWIRFSNYTLEPADSAANAAGGVFPDNLKSKVLFSWDINSVNAEGHKKIELKQHVNRFRSEICNHVLSETHNNQSRTAKILGIDTGSLAKYRQFDASQEYRYNANNGDRICRVYVVK
jgi:anaerobic nitric oxide reductase transcription regulator